MNGCSDRAERFRRHAVTPEEALARLLERVRILSSETVPLAEAFGRRLAAQAVAPHPFPPFRRSAMDGFAVRAEDLPPEGASDVWLEVTESIPAGTVPRHPVGRGRAARIMTGGMLPDGADTVVMLEMTETEERDGRVFVRIRKPVPRGRNVADIGSELCLGETLLRPGRLVGAGETALLAACGYASAEVFRRPRVGILSTGSELLDIGEPLQPGKIRNSNLPMLAALLREHGAEPVPLGLLPDRAEAVEAAVRQGLESCDLLITTGGVSVGDSDELAHLLADWDGELLFNKVAMRPGSPTSAAVRNGKLLLALSGNPGACFVGGFLFAVPVLLAMQGAEKPEHMLVHARLAEPFPKINAFPRYVRSRFEYRGDGTLWVRPAGEDNSSLMTTLAEADCLAVVPPLKEELPEGALIPVIPLRKGIPG